jgi:hypothetical protein
MMIKKGAVLRLFFLSAVLNIATANLLNTLFNSVGDSPLDTELDKLTGKIDFVQFHAFFVKCSKAIKLKKKNAFLS